MYGKTSFFGLASLLAVALPSVNAFATTGCYPAGALTTVLNSVLTIPNTGVLSPSLCATTCAGLSKNFGYYDGNLDTCYCTDVTPLLSTVVSTVGTIVGGNGETVCQAGNLEGLDVNTPYTNFGCALPSDTVATNPVSGGLLNVLSISSCLAVCNEAGYKFAYITNLAVSLCRCSANVEIQNPSTCGLLRNFIYVNLAPTPTGGLTRRALAARRASEKVGLCPAGLQACSVKQGLSASDDFECLDTKAELESCGGCTAGILDGDASLATSGTDCTAIAGVEMGAVSCVSGQCQVSKCKSGYALVDNTCVSTRSVAAMALGALRLQNL